MIEHNLFISTEKFVINISMKNWMNTHTHMLATKCAKPVDLTKQKFNIEKKKYEFYVLYIHTVVPIAYTYVSHVFVLFHILFFIFHLIFILMDWQKRENDKKLGLFFLLRCVVVCLLNLFVVFLKKFLLKAFFYFFLFLIIISFCFWTIKISHRWYMSKVMHPTINIK